MRYFITVFLILLQGLAMNAQALPPIINFGPNDYKAGNQNWMISQGDDKQIYVANNSGLLQFDGEHWDLYQAPEKTALRSVLASGDRVFTGSYMDFGYWKPNRYGRLQYISLKDSIASGLVDGEQFWDIKEVDDHVIFQSHQRLYSFNKNSGQVGSIVTEKNISNLFKIRKKIYFQVVDKGLFVVEDGFGKPFISNNKIGNKVIVGLFPYGEEKILAVTRDNGLFIITGNQWEVFPIEGYPSSESFFSAEYLEDGSLALGSIGGGLYVIDALGKKKFHISQPTVMNNTFLSIMEDKEGNLWGGLDNGIAVINKNSRFRLFVDTFGDIGTVYCSAVVDGIIYLGSNQGLYYKEKEAEGIFKLVPGTTGQVWSINQIDDELYVGHDRGAFIVKDSTANLVWQGLGTWTVKKIGEGIIQGHYNGISYLPKDSPNSNARYLDNFDLSSRNILVENDSIIWVGHNQKGVLRLKLSKDYKKVLTVESYETGKSGLGPEIFSYNEQIYCSTQSGIFLYDRKQNRFTPNNELNSITKRQERISGISTVLADGSLWTFGRDNLYYLIRDPFEQKLIERKVPLPLENRNITNGFENISLLEKDQYLVGSNVGYIQFSLPIADQQVEQFAIRSIAASSKGESYVYRLLNTEELQLKNKVNNLLFYFSVPDYQSLNLTEYSYRLVNFSPFWSKWDEYGTAEFENLPPGSYTFEVKARNNGMETDVLRYSFLIMEPWYYSNLAIAGYILLFLLGFLLVHYIYRRRHLKILEQRERNLKMKALEAEQKVIKLQKQHLERDMAEKNGQLAASTMSLIKKNEFLSNLKEELKTTAENAKVKGVIRTIDNEIKEEDNWKMFKEAFKNADKEFFDKIKSKHPNLSSNDLRLCAYLRLNLSSKEIAPLINISVKSVEIKRYRLRKKMNLPREVNLTDYIIEI